MKSGSVTFDITAVQNQHRPETQPPSLSSFCKKDSKFLAASTRHSLTASGGKITQHQTVCRWLYAASAVPSHMCSSRLRRGLVWELRHSCRSDGVCLAPASHPHHGTDESHSGRPEIDHDDFFCPLGLTNTQKHTHREARMQTHQHTDLNHTVSPSKQLHHWLLSGSLVLCST